MGKKTKRELIEEIRTNLQCQYLAKSFQDADNYIKNSSEEEFIIIVTKSTIEKLNLINSKKFEIN